MLRVHFTVEDLSRVRVATAPDPLWEITNSFQTLLTDENPLVFGRWRQYVRSRIILGGQMLGLLLPPRGYSPDFLTPDLGGRADLERAVEKLLSTPRSTLRGDLVKLAASRTWPTGLPVEIRTLALGDFEALRRLGSDVLAYHRQALAPFWPQIQAQLEADRALRTRAVLTGGVQGLLDSYRPVLRWRFPVLEIDYPIDRELHLEGRGLLLQPSFFCSRNPVALADPELPPVVVHPIQHVLGWAHRREAERQETQLGELLGRTRAAILEESAKGRTTGELATRFGISGAAASYHTAVLRRAGLVLSARRGRFVLHTITPIGLALLERPRSASPHI